MGAKNSNLIGKRYGKLVIDRDSGERTKHGQIIFFVNCDCGNKDYKVARDCIDRPKYGTKQCPKCKIQSKTQGYGEITGTWWGQHFVKRQLGYNPSSWSKSGYRGEVYETDMTAKEGWELFLKQDRKCALSGVDLFFPKKEWGGTASLDRIDSTKGYLLNNVQWAHKDVNMMKNNLNQEDFIEICRLITENQVAKKEI